MGAGQEDPAPSCVLGLGAGNAWEKWNGTLLPLRGFAMAGAILHPTAYLGGGGRREWGGYKGVHIMRQLESEPTLLQQQQQK